jgi:hypothetical protein
VHGISQGRAAAALEEEEEEEENEWEDEDEDEVEEEEEEEEAGMGRSARLQQRYLELRAVIRDNTFWDHTKEVLGMLAPLLRDLKIADEDRPLMGFVWPMMLALHRQAEAELLPESERYAGQMPLSERKKFCDLIVKRWAYLHVPLHSAAYCLNPRFHGADHFADPEVHDDFVSVLREMLDGEVQVSVALAEYKRYHEKTGPWVDSLIWAQAKDLEPHAFGEWYRAATAVALTKWV